MGEQGRSDDWGGWDAHIQQQLDNLKKRRDRIQEQIDGLQDQIDDLNQDIEDGEGFLSDGDDQPDQPPTPSAVKRDDKESRQLKAQQAAKK